jgi:hypothetical protein
VSQGNTVPVSASGYTYAADGNRLLQAATGGLSRAFSYDATGTSPRTRMRPAYRTRWRMMCSGI